MKEFAVNRGGLRGGGVFCPGFGVCVCKKPKNMESEEKLGARGRDRQMPLGILMVQDLYRALE